MTTLNLVPNTGDELPSRQISRRIRGLMAERRISGVKMAESIGMNQRAFARRYADEVDWSFDETALVAKVLGVTFADLISAVEWDVTPATDDEVPPGTTGG
jgi:butyrate kinase